MSQPRIIQGGMGVGVSGWPLAAAVSRLGQMGVVSGVVLDVVFARRLQEGDAGGHMRRALDHFPVPEIARRVWDRYFIAGGKAAGDAYKKIPMFTVNPGEALLELGVVSNFAEVWLAKEGHNGVVGINYLEKLQLANLAPIYGAMLAGVDYVCMGAGIPREIPGVLDRFVNHNEATLRLDVDGALPDDDFRARFDPRALIGRSLPKLNRPKFLAIIASAVLAISLAKKSTGQVDGFVIEAPTAGGHNAPPRGGVTLGDTGEPVYGPRDEVDFAKIKGLGLPFWLAGCCAYVEKLRSAEAAGAAGVQIGTPLAFCRESSLTEEIKAQVIRQVIAGDASVFTDPVASPTGFPFKVARVPGSLSDADVYEARPRLCDLGYLRQPYKKDDGSLGYRCPAEPVDAYLRKGGKAEETVGRKCLCNGLIANIGHPQVQKNGYLEPPIITAGDDLANIGKFLKPGAGEYSADDVINNLLRERT